MPDQAMPSTVGDLRAYTVAIRCRRCGRIAPIEPAKMTTAGGRALDRRMTLTAFLSKLTCTEKACGEKPFHLHVSVRIPGAPGEAPGPAHRWIMDARGRWNYLGTADGQ